VRPDREWGRWKENGRGRYAAPSQAPRPRWPRRRAASAPMAAKRIFRVARAVRKFAYAFGPWEIATRRVDRGGREAAPFRGPAGATAEAGGGAFSGAWLGSRPQPAPSRAPTSAPRPIRRAPVQGGGRPGRKGRMSVPRERCGIRRGPVALGDGGGAFSEARLAVGPSRLQPRADIGP